MCNDDCSRAGTRERHARVARACSETVAVDLDKFRNTGTTLAERLMNVGSPATIGEGRGALRRNGRLLLRLPSGCDYIPSPGLRSKLMKNAVVEVEDGRGTSPVLILNPCLLHDAVPRT